MLVFTFLCIKASIEHFSYARRTYKTLKFICRIVNSTGTENFVIYKHSHCIKVLKSWLQDVSFTCICFLCFPLHVRCIIIVSKKYKVIGRGVRSKDNVYLITKMFENIHDAVKCNKYFLTRYEDLKYWFEWLVKAIHNNERRLKHKRLEKRLSNWSYLLAV